MLLWPHPNDRVYIARYIADNVLAAKQAGEDYAAPVCHLLDVIDRIITRTIRDALLQTAERIQDEEPDNILGPPYRPTEEILREG